MSHSLKEVNVVVLCGGIGKRLAPVIGDNPKALADINGKAFLDILIDNLLQFGFRQFILSVGYKKEKIIDHFTNREKKRGYTLLFSEEETPLGTGGALKNAASFIKGNTFLVMNGDTFCGVAFNKLLDFHINKKALLTMVLTRSKMTQDYGSIKIDNSCRIKDYQEKISSDKGKIVNAGIYLMERDIFSKMPDASMFSLEYDFFPTIKGRRCYGYLIDSELIDIGTPERYMEAKKVFESDPINFIEEV